MGTQITLSDGPFAETKEQLGGILFLEADDMPHAIELMSKHPGVKFGPFEIRPADETINAMIKERGLSSENKNSEKNTVRLHRVLRAPAERVYKAFLDADALCRWLPPYGFVGKIHEIDIKIGGGYHLPGEMDVTIHLRKVLCGTELTIVQAGIPDAIPIEMCYHGWQESLLQLANLVEHEIPV